VQYFNVIFNALHAVDNKEWNNILYLFVFVMYINMVHDYPVQIYMIK